VEGLMAARVLVVYLPSQGAKDISTLEIKHQINFSNFKSVARTLSATLANAQKSNDKAA